MGMTVTPKGYQTLEKIGGYVSGQPEGKQQLQLIVADALALGIQIGEAKKDDSNDDDTRSGGRSAEAGD